MNSFKKYLITLSLALITVAYFGCKKSDDVDVAVQNCPTCPLINSLDPSSGYSGQQVRIIGRNFSGTLANNKVYFNGIVAVLDSVNSLRTVVYAKAPILNVVNAKVTIDINGLADTVGQQFHYLSGGLVNDSIEGMAGNIVQVVATGPIFFSTTPPNILFPSLMGGVTSVVSTYVDPTKINFSIPSDATDGIALMINNSDTTNLVFDYLEPELTSVFKDSAQSGDPIVISGRNFSLNASDNIIEFPSGVTLPAASVSGGGTSLSVIVPSGAGSGFVSVTTLNHPSNSLAFKYLLTFTTLPILFQSLGNLPKSKYFSYIPNNDFKFGSNSECILISNTDEQTIGWLDTLYNAGGNASGVMNGYFNQSGYVDGCGSGVRYSTPAGLCYNFSNYPSNATAFIADFANNVIRKCYWIPAGSCGIAPNYRTETFGISGLNTLYEPVDVVVDGSSNSLYICGKRQPGLQQTIFKVNLISSAVTTSSYTFNGNINGLALDLAGNLYCTVSSSNTSDVLKFPSGNISLAPAVFSGASNVSGELAGLCFDNNGVLYSVDRSGSEVWMFEGNGAQKKILVNNPAINQPWDIVYGGGYLWVLDYNVGNARVVRVQVE